MAPETSHSTAERGSDLLRRDEVAAMLTVSTRTLHRLVGTRDFPSPIRIGRAVRWRRRTIAAYIDRDQKRAERKPRTSVN